MENTMKNEILDRVAAAESVLRQHKKQYAFDIDVDGVQGHFVAKYPTLMDKMQIGVTRAKLIGGLPAEALDTITDNISFMTATLGIVLIEKPDWFNLDQLDSYAVLEAVYDKFDKWVSAFQNPAKQDKSAGGSRTTEPKEPISDDAGIQSSN